jgi:hypothetical protein
MSVIKRSDVNKHFSPNYIKGMHLDRTSSQPNATDLLATKQGESQANSNPRAQDLQVEDSSPVISLAPNKY